MPVIDLLVEPPLPGAPIHYLYIESAMLFPRDETARQQWLAAGMANVYHAWVGAGGDPEAVRDLHPWMARLWELKLSPERVFSDGRGRINRASLSGYILLELMRLAKFHPRHCKLERAKALLVEYTTGVSSSLIDKVWADFKTVSHLWAAFAWLVEEGWRAASNQQALELLAEAESLRVAAEGLRFFVPGESWRASDGQKLPDSKGLGLQPVSGEMEEFLNRTFP